MFTSRAGMMLGCGLLCLLAFLAGWYTGQGRQRPGRPEPGETVSAPWLSEELPILVQGRTVDAAGRWLQTGNISFPVFPVRPVVEALGGRAVAGEDTWGLLVCGRQAAIRFDPGVVPRTRSRWPLRAGVQPGAPRMGPTNGVWMRFGEVLASPEWLREALGLEAEWHYPQLKVEGCR